MSIPNVPKNYTVSSLNQLVSELFEGASFLKNLELNGEISGLKKYASGHWYFSLKDAEAEIRCVFFGAGRQMAANLAALIGNGDDVVATGSVRLYAAKGEYQFLVNGLRRKGLGELLEALLALKLKLQKEGLFESERKQALPFYPKGLALVTSPKAAAREDVLRTLSERYPIGRVILFPCSVQGNSAPAEIVSAIKAADKHPEVDVILVVRGGGTFEDLYCFNDERVVRAVANASKPVVSGVGHETDRTLIDEVADYAAHTPTAAALAATPDLGQAALFLETEAARLTDKGRAVLSQYNQTLDELSKGLIFKAYQKLDQNVFELDQTQERFQRNVHARLLAAQNELTHIEARLHGIDPKATLARGFSITTLNGKPVFSAKELPIGAEILTTFVSGTAQSTVTQTN